MSIPSRQTAYIFIVYCMAYASCFLLSWLMQGYADFSLWFPAAGLRFALIFVFGWRVGLLTILAEILTQGALGWWSFHKTPFTMLVGIGWPPLAYTLVIYGLERLRLTNGQMRKLHDLIWFCVGSVLAPALAAVGAATVGYWMRDLPLAEMAQAIMSFWIGDTIGVLMIAPWLAILLVKLKSGDFRITMPESVAIAEFLAAGLVCWLTSYLVTSDSITIEWLPFLVAVLWMAVRYGFLGAALFVCLVNLVIVLPASGLAAVDRVEIQTFLLVVSFTGILIGGAVSLNRDKRLQLQDSFRTIALLDRKKSAGDMAAQLVHELTQPIQSASIYTSGALKLVEEGKMSPEELVDVLKNVQHITERSAEQVSRYRAFLKSGELQKEDTTVQEIIEGVKGLIKIAAGNAGVKVTYELPDEPLPLLADTVQIQQAILNLVKNSIEAMESSDEKQIAIEAGLSNEDRVFISVADTGSGLPDDLQVDISTKSTGMGLGLKIVETIINAHCGELHFSGQIAMIRFGHVKGCENNSFKHNY